MCIHFILLDRRCVYIQELKKHILIFQTNKCMQEVLNQQAHQIDSYAIIQRDLSLET